MVSAANPESDSQSGFSLIELMVALAITAILASIAAPSFRTVIANTRIQAVASDLQAGMLLARSEAVKRNAPVRLVATDDKWVNGWSVQDADGTVLLAGQVHENVSIKGNAATWTFLASGRVNGVSVPKFQLVDELEIGDVRCLTADRGGRAYVVKQACES